MFIPEENDEGLKNSVFEDSEMLRLTWEIGIILIVRVCVPTSRVFPRRRTVTFLVLKITPVFFLQLFPANPTFSSSAHLLLAATLTEPQTVLGQDKVFDRHSSLENGVGES